MFFKWMQSAYQTHLNKINFVAARKTYAYCVYPFCKNTSS